MLQLACCGLQTCYLHVACCFLYCSCDRGFSVCVCSCTNDITARKCSGPSFCSPVFFGPAVSGLAIWSVIFRSCIFRCSGYNPSLIVTDLRRGELSENWHSQPAFLTLTDPRRGVPDLNPNPTPTHDANPDPNNWSIRRGIYRKLILTHIPDPNRYQFCTR